MRHTAAIGPSRYEKLNATNVEYVAEPLPS
jgi:hypothetical protein